MSTGRPRGRPRKSESAKSANPKRQGRVPLTTKNILTVRGKKGGWVYRWVTDEDDRLFRFMRAGWVHVMDRDGKYEVGDPAIHNPSTPEGVVCKARGTTKQFLMAIEKEFYDEDQKAKQLAIDEAEASMYRQFKSKEDGQYQPGEGVQIHRGP